MGDRRPGVTDAEYERLRRAAPTHRADLVLRLGGEAGLRPAEMAGLRPGDVTTVTRGGRDQYLLVLDGREAYLPRDLERDLRQYANSNDIDPSDALFEVSTRRLQMIVREVGERAAETGSDDLAAVSSQDLRAYFARRRLAEGVSPVAVLASGGWSSLDALTRYLDEPDREALLEAFGDDPGDPVAPTAVEVIRTAGEGLVSAMETDQVRARVAEALTASGRYRRAWVEPPEDVALDDGDARLRERLSRESPPLYAQAHTSGTVQTTSTASDGVAVVAPVPRQVAPSETLVVETSVLSRGEADLLGLLGSLVGLALTVVHQRRRHRSDTVLRVTFRYESSPLTRLTAITGCSISLAGAVPGDSLVLFVDVRDVGPERFLTVAGETDGLSGVRLVSDYGASARYEVIVESASPLPALVGGGASLVDLAISGGQADVTLEVLPETDLRSLQNAAESTVSSFELRSKRAVERSDRTTEAASESLGEELTDRQASALRAAHLGGYFEWPRESTAETIAESLDVSSPTFHQHLRKAQRKLLDVYFETTQQA